MKLSDLLAKVAGLEKRLATVDAAEFAALKATVDGALTQAHADLDTAKASIAKLTADLSAAAAKAATAEGSLATVNGALADANAALVSFLGGLNQKPAEGASLQDNIRATCGAVTSALAAQGLRAEDLPASSPNAGGTAGPVDHIEEYHKLQAKGDWQGAAAYWQSHIAGK